MQMGLELLDEAVVVPLIKKIHQQLYHDNVSIFSALFKNLLGNQGARLRCGAHVIVGLLDVLH